MRRTNFDTVNPKKVMTFVAVIFLVAGLIMLAAGITVKRYQARGVNDQVAVNVEVIRIDARKMRRRKNEKVRRPKRDRYRPVFQATIPSGEVITHESSSWSRPSAYDVGDKLAGFYNARTGALNTAKTLQNQSVGGTLVTLLGVIFAAGGALALIVMRVLKRRTS